MATATTTATETARPSATLAGKTATSDAPALRNPKDSMKSTWRADPNRTGWGYFHKLIIKRGLYFKSLTRPVPTHEKSDKVPYLPEWQVHLWILYHAAIPLAIHQAYITYTGKSLHPIAMIAFYAVFFQLIGLHQLNVMRNMGHRYGFLDGDKHERDDVPDHSVAKTVISLILTVTLRQVMSVVLSYDRTQAPRDMDLIALPFEIALYSVVLDFWFYWYHRVMHHYDGLWKFHRTHHLTKHPSALLTLHADEEQEVFDMIGIPLMTFITLKVLGLPMGFYEWWICHQYIVWTELTGHSGLRVHVNTPNPISWLLKMFDCELVIEDHDLHHRKGWKKSHNYGKQTRLWDRVFGTCHDRIESREENIDYNNQAFWPTFW